MNDVNLESNSIWEKYQKKENLPNEYNDIIEKIKSKENPNFLDPLKVLGPITYKENEYSFEEKSKDNSSKDIEESDSQTKSTPFIFRPPSCCKRSF